MVIIIILLVNIIALVYYFLTWNFNYWPKKNVKGPKPKPLLGNFPSIFLRKQHFGDDLCDIYKLRYYKDTESFVGVYLMRSPQLLILDPHIVHEIFVNAFNSFEDNDVGKLIDRDKDPLIAKNPFLLMGEEWRLQRSLISPALTSSRIKQSYKNMQNVCQQLIKFINEQSCLSLNGKDLALRFTSESLSDCVLGIKAYSFSVSPLPIAANVKKFTKHNLAFIVYTIIVGLLPNILHFYKCKFFPKDCEAFFMNLMGKAFKLRYKDDTDNNDILSHLIKIKKLYKLQDNDIYSHTMTFLIDGLDTTATVISHCLLMLACEPVAQEILYQEVMAACDENGLISFEKLNEMSYLDACIHESLRIYPPGLWSTKRCTQEYELKNKNGQTLTVAKGETILIPIYALHHDTEYYPEPQKFQPDRFLQEKCGVKQFKDNGVFLGFGDGPRTCLGMRFALVQCKSAISSIIKTFYIELNMKTQRKYKLNPQSFLALHDGGVWLNFQKR